MKLILRLISGLALAGVVMPSVLFFMGRITLEQVWWAMLAATVLWFLTTPFWLERRSST